MDKGFSKPVVCLDENMKYVLKNQAKDIMASRADEVESNQKLPNEGLDCRTWFME